MGQEYLFNLIVSEIHSHPLIAHFLKHASEKLPYNLLLIENPQEKLFQSECTTSCPITILSTLDPRLIYSHLVSDIPTYFFASRPPNKDSLLPCFERIIFTNPASFKELSLLLQGSSAIWVDLNWALIGGWRDLFSELYSSPEAIQSLKSSQLITLTYQLNATQLSARYFHAWLASRLGWQPISQTRYRTEEGYCDITLVPAETNMLPGCPLHKVELCTASGETLSMARDFLPPKVNIERSNKEICEIPYSLPLPDYLRLSNLLKELLYRPFSPHYKAMIDVLNTF